MLLGALAPNNAQNGIASVAESPMPSVFPSLAISATPDTFGEPSSELLRRLNDDQRESFLRLWNTVPSHIRRIDFVLDAPGWDPSAIDALVSTPTEYADIFSPSKVDYGACSLCPFEIKVPPGTQPIQSRPYRLNSVFSTQADAIWTLTLPPGSSSIPRPRSPAPSYAFRRDSAAFESQSTIRN